MVTPAAGRFPSVVPQVIGSNPCPVFTPRYDDETKTPIIAPPLRKNLSHVPARAQIPYPNRCPKKMGYPPTPN
ncbi:hypothetical protein NDU88_002135 [Pleurodeles waltl]|uniref:Uncharacterized protein n=1 Tax=Pleurodeles waltl TaxID=8319 RepID=A0AAV7TJR4_PLEWA|nr:hypothetical protein NDU88_002135 [Pleurodeles waltl]